MGNPRRTKIVFLGSYEHSLDTKGRVSLPVRYREQLSAGGDARLVVTTNLDPGSRCLVAYPMHEWAAFQEKVSELPQFDPNVIRLKRLHIAGAAECTPDRQGRILLSPMQRDYAAINTSVVFAGIGNNIEIWQRDAWLAEREKATESLAGINNALAQFGL